MAISRRQRFVYGQVAWMLLVVLLLAVIDGLTVEAVFAGSFLGFLVLLDSTDPINIAPDWRRRLRWIIILGFLGFGYIVVQRILSIFPGIAP